MIKKNKLIIIGIIGFITSGAVALGDGLYNYFHPQYNIKLMAYKAASDDAAENNSVNKKNQNGYQIDRYENIRSVDWINENEVVSLTQKNQDAEGNPSYYCSVYNLNTKEARDYKDVSMGEYLGTSPNKQYVLYSEPRNIPKVESKEWHQALDSGDLLHKNVKILNLNTGETSDVKTEKLNSDAEFKFISDNKIIANYFDKWAIMDSTGNVITEGTYNAEKNAAIWLAGINDLKDLGDKVEGKFYYTNEIKKSKDGSVGIKVCSMDVNTKEIKDIYEGPCSLNADKKGNNIIMDYYDNNGEAVDGVYNNRTFGYYILDENGKLVHDIKQDKYSSKYILSNDGTKAVYVEVDNHVKNKSDSDNKASIKVVDTKTGDISEVFNTSSLKDSDDESAYRKIKLTDKDGNIKEKDMGSVPEILGTCWDKTGTSLIFNYEHYSDKEQKNVTDTYIVTLDK